MNTLIPEHQLSAAKLSEVLASAFYDVGDINSEGVQEIFLVSGGDLSTSQFVLFDIEDKCIKLFVSINPPPKLLGEAKSSVIANSVNSELKGEVCMYTTDDGGFHICKYITAKKGLNAFHLVDGVRTLNRLSNGICNVALSEHY